MEDSCSKNICGCTSRGLIFIPARGGSKGIKNKNMYPLLGKPLIQYTIEEAIEANLNADIVVSTDDDAIKRFSLSYGIKVIDRPAEISNDQSKTIDAVIHGIELLATENKIYSWFMLLQPTSPLRQSEQLREALSLFYESQKSVISVTDSEHHPFKDLYLNQGRYLPIRNWDDLETPRQSLPKAIRINGAIYCIGVKQLLRSGKIVQPDFEPYFMSWESSVDIDDLRSIQRSEQILKNR